MKKLVIIFALIIIILLIAGAYLGYKLIQSERVQLKVEQEQLDIAWEQLRAGRLQLEKEKTEFQEKLIQPEMEKISSEEERAEAEKEQMFEAARSYIKKYSVSGMEVELEIVKQLEKWALLEAVPITIETDNVLVVMEKVAGAWETRTFGTFLPGWKEKVPELFEVQ